MTKLELQANIFRGLKENLATFESFSVNLLSFPGSISVWLSFPGSISVWPLVDNEVAEDILEQKVYELIEEYVHTYGSDVSITYTDEAMELSF